MRATVLSAVLTVALGVSSVHAETGVASYYDKGFSGHLTADGERFDPQQLTAASRHLNFGTRVKVTNLHNGRSTVVRINDRGPYAEGRILDLSRAAATRLGMLDDGVAPVRVTRLDSSNCRHCG